MPNYKGHIAGGFVAYGIALCLATCCSASWATSLEWLLFTLAGSLFPDIDIKSKGQKLFYRLMFVVLLILMYQRRVVLAASIGVLCMVPMIVRHRGMLHKLWFVILFPSLLAFVCTLYVPCYAPMIAQDAFFFIMGAVSHVWLDVGLRRMLRW